jgi:hypothetical protein
MIVEMIRFFRIVVLVITRRLLLSTAQPTNLSGNNRENYFAYLLQRDDRLDLISFLKALLIVSPESDELSREKTFFSRLKNDLP